jgi:hypothetical protein
MFFTGSMPRGFAKILTDNNNYLSADDWFDYGTNTGNFDHVTQNVWKYQADEPPLLAHPKRMHQRHAGQPDRLFGHRRDSRRLRRGIAAAMLGIHHQHGAVSEMGFCFPG